MNKSPSKLNLKMSFLLSAFLLNCSCLNGEPLQGAGIEYLQGEGGVHGIRLVYHPYIMRIDDKFTKSIYLSNIDVNYEISFNIWRFDTNNSYDKNLAISFSPVLSKQFSRILGKPLKWEAGIGLSVVEDTRFAGKDIGSHYQFEDRIGLKIVLNENSNESVSIRYIHYSNGGLNDKNPGLDFFNISYTKTF